MIRMLLWGVALLLAAIVLTLVATRRRYEISAATHIDRPPAEVWAVLTATAAYPSWNPFIRRLDGRLAEGDRILIEVGTGADTMRFRPVVLEVAPYRALRWRGSVGANGIFDGDHRFALQADGAGTRFVQSEIFTGLLVGTLTHGLIAGTQSDFLLMNQALKARVEGNR